MSLVEVHENLAQFVAGELATAMTKQRVTLSPLAEMHVVALLSDARLGSFHPDDILAYSLLSALRSERMARRIKLGEVGDRALLNCGLWWERQCYRGQTGQQRYCGEIGRRAYGSVQAMPYDELADLFDDVVGVLNRFAMAHQIATPVDLLRLYQLWEETHNHWAGRELVERGFVPVPPGTTDPS